MKQITILNGPNLNLLGTREPEIYGATTLADIEKLCAVTAQKHGLAIDFKQSNHEGDLVEWVQQAGRNSVAIIINAGGYTHTSVAIHDALRSVTIPIYEVHLSNIYAREEFRHKSLISPVAKAVLCGLGAQGYAMMIDMIASK